MSQSLRVSRIQFAAYVDIVLWRALAFTRSVDAQSPWAAKQLRRAVLLVWWTATFQLHIHARYWLRARRSGHIEAVAAPVPVIEAAVAETIDPRTLEVPSSENPLVSVIVPTYGQVPFTLRCLASIAEHTSAETIEVIVIDDAWDGPDASALDLVRGIRIICNETNLGFLRSCNKAAARATAATSTS